MNPVTSNIKKIMTLCKKYKVSKLFVFGSVLTDQFSDDSDIDLVVSFKDIDLVDYADNYFEFKDALTQLFRRKVDLLEDKAIKNSYLRENIDRSKQLIYG